MSYPWLQLEARRDPARQWLTWAVRMKLDLCGCKISLGDWQSLSIADRLMLHEFPVENDEDVLGFRRHLLKSLASAGLDSDISFDDLRARSARDEIECGTPPSCVVKQLREWQLPIVWNDLNHFGRYVICAIASKRNPESYRDDLARLVHTSDFSRLRSSKVRATPGVVDMTVSASVFEP